MNASQLELGSAPTALDANRVGGETGLSADDRRESRARAVTSSCVEGGDGDASVVRREATVAALSADSDRREAHCGSAPNGESSHLLGQVRLTSGARAIFDEVGADSRPAHEIARRAGFIAAAVRRHLEALAAAGLVAQEGSGWRRA